MVNEDSGREKGKAAGGRETGTGPEDGRT